MSFPFPSSPHWVPTTTVAGTMLPPVRLPGRKSNRSRPSARAGCRSGPMASPVGVVGGRLARRRGKGGAQARRPLDRVASRTSSTAWSGAAS